MASRGGGSRSVPLPGAIRTNAFAKTKTTMTQSDRSERGTPSRRAVPPSRGSRRPPDLQAETAVQTIGAILRERRERAGITLADVEKATRIRQRYLLALESDEWHLLPGEVVGRGFLRNYATFLGLDPDPLIQQRRSMVDTNLARALANTSLEATLPPPRPVDYRPKDMDLVDIPWSERLSGVTSTLRDWFAPIVTVLLLGLVVLLLLWGGRELGGRLLLVVEELQGRVASLADTSSTAPEGSSGVSEQATPFTGTGGAVPGSDPGQPQSAAEPVVVVSTDTPTPEPPTPTPMPPTPTPEPPTPTPVPPTPTWTPTLPPLPTPTPVPVVEQPPTPAPPPVVAPACPDPRAVITAPGVNQVVSGQVPITGRAVHENFQFYKLEFAPGPEAQEGFAYFDGGSIPVENGLLGTFNSPAVPNGVYTIRLTVVDLSGNFPPPCQVTVTVQN